MQVSCELKRLLGDVASEDGLHLGHAAYRAAKGNTHVDGSSNGEIGGRIGEKGAPSPRQPKGEVGGGMAGSDVPASCCQYRKMHPLQVETRGHRSQTEKQTKA